MADDLTNKSAVELVALIRARAVSPVEIVEAHLRRIEKVNPELNAIVTVADDAIGQARRAEEELGANRNVGPLHGLPVTVKDTIDTAGLRTTYGSQLFATNIPSHDAPAVARLKKAGAIILGKTNTPEMAIPYETDNKVFGRTNNPYARHRTSGGSSGGEAAAIAACLSPAGLGSDLSGSIRVPAHFCGIAGLKPTTGRVPMEGHTPASTGPLSLGACVGPMARTVEDLALLFRVLADPTQFELTQTISESFQSEIANLRGLRVGWYADDGIAPVSNEIRDAVESAARAFADAGLEVTESTPPGISQGARLWVELFATAARNEIATLYQGREDEAGVQVAALLHRSQGGERDFEETVNAAERLADAVLEREKIREELLEWMKTSPLILAPVGATAAFEHGAGRVEVAGQSISVFRAFSYSQTFNVFGFPAVAVPAGRTESGLPIGIQIIGRPFEERTVLAAASVIETALGGWQKPDR